MNPFRTGSTLAAGILVSAALSAPSTGAATLDGKQIFQAQKCDMCHSVSSAGITPTSKIKAPDLSGLASKEDPAWIGKFLKKEAEKNGKKHLKLFSGTDEELSTLVAWLQKQTEPAKK